MNPDPHDIRKSAIEDQMIQRNKDIRDRRDELPSVTGRMQMTHADFQRACQLALGEWQDTANPPTDLIALLCEAVRCSRECCEIAGGLETVALLATKDAEIASLRRAEGLMCAEIDNKDARIVELGAECAEMRQALAFYADFKRWIQCEATGDVCEEIKDGDPMLVFLDGEEHPHSVARDALESNNCGKHLLDRLKEAEWLLWQTKNLVMSRPWKSWRERRNAFLKGVKL